MVAWRMLESLKSKLEDLKHRWNSTDADIHLYSFVAEEIEGGRIHKGLWLKALSESQSDEAKAKAKYTKYRVAAVRKVMPEVAELAAAEELETQVVISLENRIASAESRVRDSSIEYQQVTTALDFNSAQHKSLQKKLAGINTDYKQKLADQHFIREAIKELGGSG